MITVGRQLGTLQIGLQTRVGWEDTLKILTTLGLLARPVGPEEVRDPRFRVPGIDGYEPFLPIQMGRWPARGPEGSCAAGNVLRPEGYDPSARVRRGHLPI